jgi:aspartate aminotransferase
MVVAASEIYTSTSSPIQYAAVRAFEGGLRIERYLAAVRRILSTLGKECAERLLAAGVHVVAPKGAFYLFADFTPIAERLRARGLTSSRAFCDRLLAETGVAVLPGSEFGRPHDELTARIAYVDFDGARALAALESMRVHGGNGSGEAETELPASAARLRIDREWLANYCEPVLQAIDRIVAFVER